MTREEAVKELHSMQTALLGALPGMKCHEQSYTSAERSYEAIKWALGYINDSEPDKDDVIRRVRETLKFRWQVRTADTGDPDDELWFMEWRHNLPILEDYQEYAMSFASRDMAVQTVTKLNGMSSVNWQVHDRWRDVSVVDRMMWAMYGDGIPED